MMQKILLGLDETCITQDEILACKLHTDVVAPLHELKNRADTNGFSLKIASSYRSFERQLLIWNHKALGLRPTLTSEGVPIDLKRLSDREKVFAILRWSALPGASRHHWGTDVDVYDSAAITENYTVQLTLAETEGNGVFAEFHRWLSKDLQRADCHFYRPYAKDNGGIAPEPWHLSYAPVAQDFAKNLSEDLLRAQLTRTDFELKATVLDNLSEIYARFVRTE